MHRPPEIFLLLFGQSNHIILISRCISNHITSHTDINQSRLTKTPLYLSLENANKLVPAKLIVPQRNLIMLIQDFSSRNFAKFITRTILTFQFWVKSTVCQVEQLEKSPGLFTLSASSYSTSSNKSVLAYVNTAYVPICACKYKLGNCSRDSLELT